MSDTIHSFRHEDVTRFRLYLFGPPRLEKAGVAIELETRKALALLAYLAVSETAHSREHLAALFWPEQDESSARAGLRHALYVARQALDDAIVVSDRQSVQVVKSNLWVDVDRFGLETEGVDTLDVAGGAAQVASPMVNRLAAAVERYGAGFLAGFTLPDCPDFDRWQFYQAEQLHRRQSMSLALLVDLFVAQRNWERAIVYAQQRLILDVLDEDAHRTLMRVYAQAGERSAALRQYEESVRVLRQELDAEPAAETSALADAIRSGEKLTLPGRNWSAVPEYSAPVILHNLPPAATVFVGRDEELDTLQSQLARPHVRLVTIVGPGGIGKTRLALATAEAIRQSGTNAVTDGVWFVSLAALSTVEYAVTAIGSALNLSFPGGVEPRSYLLQQLGNRHMLLILDNLEHLMAVADLIAEILAAAPTVMLLITSRERLNLREEWVLDLAGLHYPQDSADQVIAYAEPDALHKLEQHYDAVKLFASSARQSQANFEVNQDNAAAVIRICHLVRGMPLALELAAGWIHTMSVQEIAHEISQGMDLLSTRLRNVPERHRSMRVVFDHSWRLLTPVEQKVYAQLAVFCCDVARPAALAVAGASLPILASLVDKSLLRREQNDRYLIHELLRQYSGEMLAQDGPLSDATEQAFADYYATFLQERESALSGPLQQTVLDEIAAEFDHVRMLWDWAVKKHDLEVLNRTMHCLWKFSEARGMAQEMHKAFDRAIQAISTFATGCTQGDGAAPSALIAPSSAGSAPAAPTSDEERRQLVLGRLLVRQSWLSERTYRPATQSVKQMQRGLTLIRNAPGNHKTEIIQFLNYAHIIHYFLGHVEEAEALSDEAICLASELGNRWLWAQANYTLAQTREFQGEYPEAVRLFDLALPIFRELGDESYLAYTLNNQYGRAALAMGNYVAARRGIEEALDIRRRVQDPFAIGYSLLDLGRLALCEGNYAEARRNMEESLAIAEKHGNADSIARVCNGLGHAARLMGELEQATAYHERSLAVYRDVETVAHQPVALNGLGAVAMARGNWVEATRYYQESLALSQRTRHVGQAAEAELGLARCALMVGERPAAWTHLQNGFAITQRIEAAPLALDGVLIGAGLTMYTEDVYGHRLLLLVSRHPATRYETRQMAHQQLAMCGYDGDPRPDGDHAAEMLDLWPTVAKLAPV